MMVGAMIAGAALFFAAFMLRYVEWDNAQDSLTTLGMVVGPPIAVGAALLLLGRFVHGGGRRASPILSGAGWALRVSGAVIAAAMTILLALLLIAGVNEGDEGATLRLAFGVAMGFAFFFLGERAIGIARSRETL